MLVGCLPFAFTACGTDSNWCTQAYWITESAGKKGTLVILLIACFSYTLRIESKKHKLKIFVKSFLALGVLLSAVAFLNEHVTKEALRIPRPSHLFIVQNSFPVVTIDSLYQLEETERKKTVRNLINADSSRFGKIDSRILNHWVEEAGYSFPSGHSFNAFTLATILAFSMYHARNKAVKRFYLFPFFWALMVAISRVSVGAHSALDVSFGAALGLIFGNLFLFVDYTRSIITERE